MCVRVDFFTNHHMSLRDKNMMTQAVKPPPPKKEVDLPVHHSLLK
jgi:hypothetical protein